MLMTGKSFSIPIKQSVELNRMVNAFFFLPELYTYNISVFEPNLLNGEMRKSVFGVSEKKCNG